MEFTKRKMSRRLENALNLVEGDLNVVCSSLYRWQWRVAWQTSYTEVVWEASLTLMVRDVCWRQTRQREVYDSSVQWEMCHVMVVWSVNMAAVWTDKQNRMDLNLYIQMIKYRHNIRGILQRQDNIDSKQTVKLLDTGMCLGTDRVRREYTSHEEVLVLSCA